MENSLPLLVGLKKRRSSQLGDSLTIWQIEASVVDVSGGAEERSFLDILRVLPVCMAIVRSVVGRWIRADR